MTRSQMEERRMQAAQDIRSGMSLMMLGQKYAVSLTTAWRWRRKLKRYGVQGMKRTTSMGRPPRLNPDQMETLRAAWIEGFPTRKEMAQVIWDAFRIEFQIDHMARLKRKLRAMAPAAPRREHPASTSASLRP